MRMMLTNGMILDAKRIMDDVLPDMNELYEMVPHMLHPNLEQFIRDFRSGLADCAIDNLEGK